MSISKPIKFLILFVVLVYGTAHVIVPYIQSHESEIRTIITK